MSILIKLKRIALVGQRQDGELEIAKSALQNLLNKYELTIEDIK